MGNQPTTLLAGDPLQSVGRKTPPPLPPPATKTSNLIKKLSLSKLTLTLKRKPKKNNFYPVPANAERPSPPSCPEVFQDQDQYFVLRWDPPAYDGGCPIIGYIIQHLELGLPQLDHQYQDDAESWYSSEPGQITQTECILNNLVPGTTYQFRILAENLIGYSLPSGTSDAIVFNPHGELDDWFYPPSFTTLLEDSYTCMEHEMLTLSVELKGQPYPMVRWYGKHDQDLSREANGNGKFRMRSSGYTRTLVITNVELTDAGSFRCVGSNKEGNVECVTTLKVEAPPRIKRVQSPEFLQNPYDLNEREEERLNMIEDDYEDLIFQAGELVRLKFFYSGSPKPDLLLFHNGEIVNESHRIVTEFTEKVITIRVENILRSDRGEWLVKLENVLGEDCTSVLITITDQPAPPGQPEILQLSDNTCILRWDDSEDDGGCPIHNYIVEYFRSEWGVWLKALTSKTPSAKIRDLIPGSKYMFRVKAENLYGVSDASVESAEILITDTPSEVLMSTVEESIEEEDGARDRVFNRNSLAEDEEEELLIAPPPPPRTNISNSREKLEAAKAAPIYAQITKTPAAEGKPIYSRSDLIPSAVTASVDYVQRYLREASKEDEEVEEEFEYDFDKLQREYEEEMRVLRDKLEGGSTEEEEEDEDDEDEELAKINGKDENEDWEVKYQRLKEKEDKEAKEAIEKQIKQQEILAKEREQKEKADKEKEKVEQEAADREDTEKAVKFKEMLDATMENEGSPEKEPEPEEYWPRRRRVVKSEENTSQKKLPDRFADYLAMKVASKDRRIGSSMRSLTPSTDAKSEEGGTGGRYSSRENIRRMCDFEDDRIRTESKSPEAPKQEEEDGEVKLSEIRKAIILLEEKQAAEEEAAALKKAQDREEEERLEALKYIRKKEPKKQDSVAEEMALVLPTGEARSKIVLVLIILLMIPIDIYYGVYAMLLAFVVLILLWNTYKDLFMS